MLKFILGIVFGVACALGYVRWGSGSFEYLSFPDKLRGGIVAGAIESELYNLEKSEAVRERALEVLFQNRADFAVRVEKEMGYPFLKALHRRKVIRDARILRGQWQAFDTALGKPALRAAYSEKYGTGDLDALKRAMLWNAFQDKEFLAAWIKRNHGSVMPETLMATLQELSRQPPAR